MYDSRFRLFFPRSSLLDLLNSTPTVSVGFVYFHVISNGSGVFKKNRSEDSSTIVCVYIYMYNSSLYVNVLLLPIVRGEHALVRMVKSVFFTTKSVPSALSQLYTTAIVDDTTWWEQTRSVWMAKRTQVRLAVRFVGIGFIDYFRSNRTTEKRIFSAHAILGHFR